MNFITINEFFEDEKDLIPLLFGDEEFSIINESMDFYDLLVILEVFPSRGQAKKNWKKTPGDIPDGYNEFTKIGKLRKAIYIWKPVESKYLLK